LGEVYRYPRSAQPEQRQMDGLPNFFWHTSTSGALKAKLDRGITRLPVVDDAAGVHRVPAILARSTPWKAGTTDTPWHDSFDVETGVIRYFGDNRIDPATGGPKEADPDDVLGNGHLLQALWGHTSGNRSERSAAGPVLVFTGIKVGLRQKGNVRFDGLGVVTGAERVRQIDEETGLPYPNLAFAIQLLDLAKDNGVVDWDWISGRRRPGTALEAEGLAPWAWRRWIRVGDDVLEELRLRRWPVEPLSG